MKVSPLRNLRFYFFLNDLDPDGCLVADQLSACTKTLESTGADKQKSLIPNWRLTLQKKDIIFCDGEVFSLDRGLLMGASINTIHNNNWFADIINAKPHIYEKWGNDHKSMANSRLRVIFTGFFPLLNHNKTKCNKKPLSELFAQGIKRTGCPKKPPHGQP